jgi:hypothetical protein
MCCTSISRSRKKPNGTERPNQVVQPIPMSAQHSLCHEPCKPRSGPQHVRIKPMSNRFSKCLSPHPAIPSELLGMRPECQGRPFGTGARREVPLLDSAHRSKRGHSGAKRRTPKGHCASAIRKFLSEFAPADHERSVSEQHCAMISLDFGHRRSLPIPNTYARRFQ